MSRGEIIFFIAAGLGIPGYFMFRFLDGETKETIYIWLFPIMIFALFVLLPKSKMLTRISQGFMNLPKLKALQDLQRKVKAVDMLAVGRKYVRYVKHIQKSLQEDSDETPTAPNPENPKPKDSLQP